MPDQANISHTEHMMTLLVVVLVLTVLAAAATRYGADSRERTGNDAFKSPPRRHTVTGDLSALGARLARAAARPQRDTAGPQRDAGEERGPRSRYPRAKTSTA
ncbi:hypothetical protein PSU4_09930 [Pseudonocardia sulfidoxydans NBRC 16205]|uniref:Uncharacterized protein n=3 Tax=Pseudonocardia sulfidoxydans TaxID=54011 RepID=A0A511DB71_9PSEU|nr:hypothetical protein PSU4_09930 [Pseudonocardia sulfidoxydans NBRC 16205]